jgi:hypothetical protein
MQTIWISDRIRLKLAEKHGGVSEDEIRQCFENLEPGWNYIRDTRDGHYSDPPTYWFISETNRRRQLKVVFIPRKVDTPDGQKVRIDIKSAFPPNAAEIALYTRRGQC